MRARRVDILMYHSIGDAPAATSISARVFAAQMDALASSGVPVISMDAVAAHLVEDKGPAVAITFDDGFRDFAEVAWPILKSHGFPAMVYLPAERIGGVDEWVGGHRPARPLMDWDTIRSLSAEGAQFGNHSASHVDLAKLDPAAVAKELDDASDRIAYEIGIQPRHAAPPYGSTGPAVQRLIAKRFETSVGTELGSALPGADLHNLPRLEMFYFNSIGRWRDQLIGRGAAYLALRRAARGLRQKLTS